MDNSSRKAISQAVRSLSMDAVEKANSGHPGMPMGMAELGAQLFGEIMSYYPKDPNWTNRDRFVLSAGHGSMFLYALLHLAGFDISLNDIQQFRQLNSKTPGHPEWRHTPGVETTTGPLGQGVANAVGMAIAETMAAACYNTEKHTIFDHYTYVLAGDGCLMEGVSAEAASLAGHLQLGKLIMFYDDNQITIDGSTDISFTEDVAMRFQAYGWQVQKGDAYDAKQIETMLQSAKAETTQPSLIMLRSVIGKGSPNKAGTAAAHGAALGAEEIKLAKKETGLPEDKDFFVPQAAYDFFAKRQEELQTEYQQWQNSFQIWAKHHPQLHAQWQSEKTVKPQALSLPSYKPGESIATRSAGQKALWAVAQSYPCLVGGSADLASSNKTKFDGAIDYSPGNRNGKIINYGVREHAMGAIANGIALYGGFRSFTATFLVFSDYMRPPMRLASLMKLPTIFVFTHDSFFVGEDGPTHQPIEHYAVLRAIPGLHVYRPGDAEETNLAWQMAIERHEGPTVLLLSRQNLPVYTKADLNWKKTIRQGAYVVQSPQNPDAVLVATGSEVAMALEAAKAAEKQGKRIRVVSMLSRELYLQQTESIRHALLPKQLPVVVAEAGISQGWEILTKGRQDLVFSIEDFGKSAKPEDLAKDIGFTVEKLTELLLLV